MRLIEIKNNLAKLEYHPADFQLVLSDFLTIDDGNQIVLAQVVSIESSKDDETNCAVIKFSLDLNADNSFCTYSGYVPTLDALVSKTKTQILESIFSNNDTAINIGQLTSNSAITLNLNPCLMDNFLYIQSDRVETSCLLFEKFMDLNDKFNKKTLYVDFDGLFSHPSAERLVLGRNFKLPIDNQILNYIYEYDLVGLTLEQKTIVQDIILEIQDYVDSLDSGYIPFNKLLDVVNDIYESDKSTGIILLRNKLLKYHQMNIFASDDSEVLALNRALEENNLTILSLAKVDAKWQKEVLDFIILNVDEIDCYLLFNIKEDAFEKRYLADIFKSKNLHPVISSTYESSFASVLKSYARNLILFKPQEQQKAFATYNSFFNKLSDNEFIISGESTYYTPLIIREIPKEIKKVTITRTSTALDSKFTSIQLNSAVEDKLVDDALVVGEIEDKEDDCISEVLESEIEVESAHISISNEENDVVEGSVENFDFKDDTTYLLEEQFDVVQVSEETLEQEIANDVDKMFYAEAALPEDDFSVELVDESQAEILESSTDIVPDAVDYNEMFSDADLDFIDENTSFEEESTVDMLDSAIAVPTEVSLGDDEVVVDDELPGLNEVENKQTYVNEEDLAFYDTSAVDNFPTVDEPIDNLVQDVDDLPIMSTSSGLLGSSDEDIPVFKTEIEQIAENRSTTKIAEGNIVYHAKYGRGVVEQMVNYGNKSFCSILFDNLGRRLLDPNLADLKQM